MQKLSEYEANELAGGMAISGIIGSILSALPIVLSAVGSTVGLIRSASSSKGEIKTKDGFNAKWEDSDNSIGFNVGFHYCI
ncbi:hypothetical protein DMC14_001155 [Metamycoplasma phocicerebrale]|uniref:Bacteriocin n=1 Tax=Metamycoplasma phocicerebrale TaxID=142649 RepID=A0A3T0TUS4_9BACT|nr:hypothetical protein DMC14_001155 [Metamycoplasma phocicerebrale]